VRVRAQIGDDAGGGSAYLMDLVDQRALVVARKNSTARSSLAAVWRHSCSTLIVPDIANPFFGPLIKSVQRQTRHQDLSWLVGRPRT
jgi:hypothetical protein